jgi:hypothetical protein
MQTHSASSLPKPTSSPTRGPSIPFDAKLEEREGGRGGGGTEVREEVGGAEVREEVQELARWRISRAVEELVRRRRRGPTSSASVLSPGR